MRPITTACFLCFGILCTQNLFAQSTISDQPLELSFGKAFWGVMLPAYDLGVNGSGNPAFEDDLDNLGALWDLKTVRRFLGTRTSFETKMFYGLARANSNSGPVGIDIPNPATGANNALAGGTAHLDSDVDHYGCDIALRDTWRTRFGGLSAGCGFSYMAFDQDFVVDYNSARLFQENLETDFLGGKLFVGWDGRWMGRRSNIDLAVGYFDMDAQYEMIGGTVAGSLVNEITRSATTVETSFSTRACIRGYETAFTFGAMYISDMPIIEHNLGAPATLNTEDAVTLKAMVEIYL